jgi:two-component system sensor histidine kinase UhpB
MNLTPINLLVIEDNPGDFFLLKEFLGMTNLKVGQVHHAAKLGDVLSITDSNRIDLVFLDLSLPDSTGHDSVKKLMEKLPVIPIIVLSGMTDLNIAMECISLGAQDYIIKGDYDIKSLEKAIHYSIERKKNQERIRVNTERFELVVNKATHDVIWEWDMEQNRIIRSRGVFRITGDKKELLDSDFETWIDHIHPADEEKFRNTIRNCIENKGETWFADYRIINNEGTIMYILDRGYVVYNDTGNAVKMVGAMMDITERKLLEEQLLEQQITHQKRITEVTIEAEEKQKNDLAIELHDNINQILATAKMYLGILRSSKNEEQNKDLVEQSYGFINGAIEEIRKLSHTLAAPSIGDINLAEALHELADDWNPVSDFRIEILDSLPQKLDIDPNMELALYRIVQEQLNNIRKYAKATLVRIELWEENGILTMEISDNGIGFDVEARKKGIGFRNMRGRTEFYSGKFQIESAPGNGSKLNIQLPLNGLIMDSASEIADN